MAATFSLILVCITLVTGVIWALDRWKWRKEREMRCTAARLKSRAAGYTDEDSMTALLQRPYWVEQTAGIFPVIATVLVLRSFLFEPFQIPSGSMMPTLLVGDFIVVKKFAYSLKDPVWHSTLVTLDTPKRGDITVFKYPKDPRIDYIKRIVGLPGDKICYQDKQLSIQTCATCEWQVIPHTQPLENAFFDRHMPLVRYQTQTGEVTHHILHNPRVDPSMLQPYFQSPQDNPGEWTVPQGHYFALGDNRDASADSRFWGFIPEQLLVGQAIGIWLSLDWEHSSSWLPHWLPSLRWERIGGIS